MAFAFVLVPGAPGLNQARAQEATQEAPKLQAESWALTDADTGLYLAGKNPDERLPIAPTTNVMTALVVLDDEGVDLDEEVSVPKEAERFVGYTYSNVGLIAGERLSVRDLLVAALVPSGTDAVYALAEHLGDGSVERFVQKMNAKASEMGQGWRFGSRPGAEPIPGDWESDRLLIQPQAAPSHLRGIEPCAISLLHCSLVCPAIDRLGDGHTRRSSTDLSSSSGVRELDASMNWRLSPRAQ
jgi:hypothetical protein